jgi:hypothetical protein
MGGDQNFIVEDEMAKDGDVLDCLVACVPHPVRWGSMCSSAKKLLFRGVVLTTNASCWEVGGVWWKGFDGENVLRWSSLYLRQPKNDLSTADEQWQALFGSIFFLLFIKIKKN